MSPLFAELLAAGPVITDGAWGTELQARGLEPGATPDFWNLEHPERVEDVARAYVEAGSRVILTNTFRANRIALGDGADVARINAEGVAISKRAAGNRAKVFASIGPTGKMMMEEDPDRIAETFREQALALAAAGADALVAETIADVEEAKLALAAAKATGLPVVVSMVFDSGKNKDRTMMGTTPEQAAAALEEAGADAIGANCGLGIDGYVGIARRLRAATSLPVWIKANAGMPEMVDGRIVYRITAEEYAAKAGALIEAGANFIGGCCGTSPAFIAALCARCVCA